MKNIIFVASIFFIVQAYTRDPFAYRDGAEKKAQEMATIFFEDAQIIFSEHDGEHIRVVRLERKSPST